jgi:spermidine/putrescine transport system ATP-binding protein
MSDFDLEFQNVSKAFGEVNAVDDVSLQVRRGEFLSLLGPSGCGKTTSLRLIAGFEQPTRGQILLNAQPVGGVPPYRRNVNTVFQHYALFPHMNVVDNVAFGLRMKRLAPSQIDQRVHRMLALVELPDVGSRFPHQLSGGQQQRIALARALVNEPTVLLLDEPLGALDLKVRRRMQQELKRIHREVGVTFIYVTHDQEEALTMSDRIAVMNRGRIEQLDAPSTIYERPRSRFVADFIGMMNVLSGVVEGHDDKSVVVRAPGGILLRGLTTQPLSQGKAVEVTVRPEKVRMSLQAPESADNCLEGRVSEIVYQGANTEYFVTLAPGSQLRVIAQNSNPRDRQALADVGTTVFVDWAASATLVMSAGDGNPAPAGSKQMS